VSGWSQRRVRGAAVLVQMEDGSMVVAELPRPKSVTVSLEPVDMPASWCLDDPVRVGDHYLSVHVDSSFNGSYWYMTPEGAAAWWAERTQGWEQTSIGDQPALPPATPAIERAT
jgi:hypothetical protein